MVNNLHAVGIRVKLRTMERAAFLSAWREKTAWTLLTSSGAAGNTATRGNIHLLQGDTRTAATQILMPSSSSRRGRGSPRNGEDRLHRIQQLTVDRVMFAPVMDLRVLHGVGSRIAEHTLNSIPSHHFFSFEAIRLKGQ